MKPMHKILLSALLFLTCFFSANLLAPPTDNPEQDKLFSAIENGKTEEAKSLIKAGADVVINYLNAQVDAGAQAIQIFDTWGGILSDPEYVRFSLKPVQKVIANLHTGQSDGVVAARAMDPQVVAHTHGIQRDPIIARGTDDR